MVLGENVSFTIFVIFCLLITNIFECTFKPLVVLQTYYENVWRIIEMKVISHHPYGTLDDLW